MKMSHKNVFFFRHLLRHFKNCNICHVLHWYASLVKILLKFELIKAHLSSFRFFLAHSGLLIWAYLGPLERFYVNLDSFRLIWARSSSIRVIKLYLNPIRLIRALLSSFGLIQASFSLFRHIWTHLNSWWRRWWWNAYTPYFQSGPLSEILPSLTYRETSLFWASI